MSLDDCRIINIPSNNQPSGNLSFIEENILPNFKIKRVYYLYDLLYEAIRGNHAYLNVNQIITAIKGDFKILLDDGKIRKEFHLNSANIGLFMPKLTWRKVYSFSKDTVILVLTDEIYENSKLIKDYSEFKILVEELELNP